MLIRKHDWRTVSEVGLTPQQWDFLFAGSIPVIVYLNTDAVLLGYDLWGEDERTKVVTRFFAQKVGSIEADVFKDFACAKKT